MLIALVVFLPLASALPLGESWHRRHYRQAVEGWVTPVTVIVFLLIWWALAAGGQDNFWPLDLISLLFTGLVASLLAMDIRAISYFIRQFRYHNQA